MKMNMIISHLELTQAHDWFIACFLIWGLFLVIYLHRTRFKHQNRTWTGILLFSMIPQPWYHPILFGVMLPVILYALFKSRSTDQQKTLTAPEKKSNTPDIDYLVKENTLLKRRIFEQSETFFTQAQFFETLLTLNEIELEQRLVEATSQFLKANQVSFYRYAAQDAVFKKTTGFNHKTGLQVNHQQPIKDKLLFLIKESRRILTIREIIHNEMLYKIWQQSVSKSLIYCPIFLSRYFIGIITIDEIGFHNLNRQTVNNLRAISRLTAKSIKNIKIYQNLYYQKRSVESKILTEYQQFLKTLNFEFKRTARDQLQLSLIYIVLEHVKGESVIGADGIHLYYKMKSSCKKNLRDVDFIYDDNITGRFWIVLPMTDFNGLAYVMERLNLIINMDLAGQSNYLCYFGFSSLDQEIKQPKQMIITCKESFRLHRAVRKLVHQKKEKITSE